MRGIPFLQSKDLNPFPKKPWFLVSAVHVVFFFFLNIAGKGDIARNEQFLLFPQCLESFLPFSTNLKLSSATSFSLEECKIGLLGKGYILIELSSIYFIILLKLVTCGIFRMRYS